MPLFKKTKEETEIPAPAGSFRQIVQKDNLVLRQKTTEIKPEEIKSPRIQQIISDMKVTLASIPDGVGLAAPQIGESVKIFIVSGRVFLKPRKRIEIDEYMEKGEALHEEDAQIIPSDLVCINPVITNYSKEKKWFDGEGCLSVRWLYGKVERSIKVKLRAYNEKGEIFERGATGLLAHVFQHEVDHLDGVLFIDKAKDLETLPEANRPT